MTSAETRRHARNPSAALPAHNPRPIIAAVARRIHVPNLVIGDNPLDAAQSHHARDVLRLSDGAEVEIFDDAGVTASGFLTCSAGATSIRVDCIDAAPKLHRLHWNVASAVPKGDRADWMVEKLSELGATSFIPLAAARSVVLPEGAGKRQRWMRLATESAKQCRRPGVMRIEELTPLSRALQSAAPTSSEAAGAVAAWHFATEGQTIPINEAIEAAREARSLTFFIGPEGGWTPAELSAFAAAGIAAVRLGRNVLRIETAAVAAAAVVACTLAV